MNIRTFCAEELDLIKELLGTRATQLVVLLEYLHAVESASLRELTTLLDTKVRKLVSTAVRLGLLKLEGDYVKITSRGCLVLELLRELSRLLCRFTLMTH